MTVIGRADQDIWQSNCPIQAVISHYHSQDRSLPQPGPDTSLQEWQNQLGADAFRAWLLSLRHRRNNDDQPWHTYSITELVEHINTTHHLFCHNELSRLEALMDNAPSGLKQKWSEFSNELRIHMNHEETQLFPTICQLEHGQNMNAEAIDGVLRELEHEHTHIEGDWASIEDELSAYEPLLKPIIRDFHRDLDLHGNLEETYLFPAAADLAERGRRHITD